MFEAEIQTLRNERRELVKTSLVDALLPFVFGFQSALPEGSFARRPGREVPVKSACGADRSRTDDIQLAKLALSQLSYGPYTVSR